MSETPLTDPYAGRWATYWHDGVTIFDLAQSLERRLREKESELAALRGKVREWADRCSAAGGGLVNIRLILEEMRQAAQEGKDGPV